MPQGLPPPSGPFMRTGSQEPGPVGTNEGKTGRKPGRAHSTAFASALYPSDLGTFLPGAGGSFSRSTFRPRRPYFPCCTAAFLSLFLFRSEALGEPRALVQTWPSPRTTPRTTSHENGTETASRNPGHKDTNLLRGPQVPEEHALCQEAQQEGPEEDAGQQCQGHGCAC
ncbi:60S ribosomal protein L29 isoform X4 [Canis lupus dingo]|uniref:60S ribosomal protein L29 isoform X4 n=1 Tax=Canis lupus dingo TaxID=286419 RepID=UPI0020C35DD7|nr:60S ribosomal protein L29 isoform X4 [Canis lupus dingo]